MLTPQTTFELRGRTYQFVEDPYYPDDVYADATGARATIYQAKDIVSNSMYALKCFKPEFAKSYSAESFNYLQEHVIDLPALRWMQGRIRINKEQDLQLVQAFPFMDNAIFMPWVAGEKLAELRMKFKNNSTVASIIKCRKIVQHLIQTLVTLEYRGFAHGDLASSNVLINWDAETVSLIDVEDMYHADIPEPSRVFDSGSGTAGYRFGRTFRSWHNTADRFAASILVAEILSLSDKQALAISQIESLFSQDMLDARSDVSTKEFDTILNAVRKFGPNPAELFRRAIYEKHLSDVPMLQDWANVFGVQVIKRPAGTFDIVHVTKSTFVQEMLYRRPANSQHPTLMVFLLDLSRSMFKFGVENNHGKQVTRFELAVGLISNIMKALVNRSRLSQTIIQPRYDIAFIGYHSKVKKMIRYPDDVFPIDYWLHQTGEFTPEKMSKMIETMKYDMDGETHMTQAFQHVHELLEKHIHKYTECHPPYVLHITDGANNDNGDPITEFRRITSLQTNYGSTLVSTAYIGDDVISSSAITHGVTPQTKFEGKRAQYADELRRISSPMPYAYIQELRKNPEYANLSDDAIMFFPGIKREMIELVLNTTIATGK
jgi:serine/threonine protein kinase